MPPRGLHMANTGIIHLAFQRGGKPFCNTRRSIMSTTVEESQKWGKVCKKCEATLLKMRERQADKAEDALNDFNYVGSRHHY